jgi:hypothetical protein
MPAPLSTPRVPPGFSLLAAAGGQTTLPGDPIIPGIEAGSQTMSLGSQTTLGTEASGPTTTPGDKTAQPLVAPSLAASSTSAMPHATPTTSTAPDAAPTPQSVPRAAPASMTPPTPLVAPVSHHYSRRPRAA